MSVNDGTQPWTPPTTSKPIRRRPTMARFDPGSDWRVRIGLQTGQLYRDHLPGEAEPVFEPAALTLAHRFR